MRMIPGEWSRSYQWDPIGWRRHTSKSSAGTGTASSRKKRRGRRMGAELLQALSPSAVVSQLQEPSSDHVMQEVTEPKI